MALKCRRYHKVQYVELHLTTACRTLHAVGAHPYPPSSLEPDISERHELQSPQPNRSNHIDGPVSPSIPPRKLSKIVCKRTRSRSRGPTSQPDPSLFSSRPHHHQPLQDKPAVINQTRCHLCYKYPRFKTQLNFYTNCERCNLRTCMICLRTCEAELGVGCMGRKVCAGCCVEKGEAGVVYCKECVEADREDEVMED
jgi:hypothetical protein